MARTQGTKSLMPADVNYQQRRALALQLRIEGLPQREIAERVGVSQPQVSRMIRQALAERTDMGVQGLRKLEDARLDALHAHMWQQAERGNVGAANVIARLMDRRAALHGLDAPRADDVAADGRFHLVTLLVGITADTPRERYDEVVEAAVVAGVEAAGTPRERTQVFVRVYGGVDIDAV